MKINDLLGFILLSAACNPEGVHSEADARRAYLGLDTAVTRGLNLGMDGYNAASSANIDAQSANGDLEGSITVSGQVDQGSSDNKELRLDVVLDGYLDDTSDSDVIFAVVYDSESPLTLDLSLRGIPDGTLSGSFEGEVWMSDDLEGPVLLDLSLEGELEAGPNGIARTEGGTQITGTATSDYGTYEVDLTR